MIRIQDAAFVRLGYSGDETFAEVQVRADGFDAPLVATFKRRPDGEFDLVHVSERRDDRALDWYDNNLHEAFPSAMEKLFGAGSDGETTRRTFAEQVLKFGDVRGTIEDTLYYGG
ncbi:hypothetical protein [Paenibacillus sp.]|uniref:hypothetical protein n=1 Tax=Paenibacillus sp. TaxID=58172 RepID=UPI002D4EB1D2|nr:hypothetical protein [Paenibacillus sp.]HZG56500.1 hypothetical protein [Paenibacillus sp.]